MSAYQEAVRAVAEASSREQGPRQGRKLAETLANPYSLTPREKEIVPLVVESLSNREIGQLLGVSEWAIKGHLLNIRAKMRCKNRTGVAVRWVREQERPE